MVRSHRNQNRISHATTKTSRNRLRGVESLEMRRLMAADIGNYIWEDLNADGIQNESAIDGVNDIEVVLFNATDNSEVDFTFTENDAFGNPGFYEFSDVPDGSYYLVVFARTSGYVFTNQGAGSDATLDSDFDRFGKSATFTVSASTTSLDFDAGLISANISSFVWWDEDENGLQADIEGGIPGVTVQLLQNGTVISSDVTDSQGLYLVGRLPAGNYALKYLYPEGFDVASQNDAPNSINDLDDSDGIGPDLITAEFAVTTSGLVTNVDQGFYKSPRVGDYVWRDVNNNGIQDEPASAGINGVSVSLFTDAGVKVADEVTRNDRSGNPGYYEFTGVTPGQYYVRFFAPEGQVFTDPSAPSAPLETSSQRDSNAQANGQTALFSVARGSNTNGFITRASEEYSIDAGLRPIIDLSLTASASNLKPPVGSTVTYSVTVTNEANLSAATGVTVKDILPDGFTYVSDNSGGFYNSTTRTWTVGTVDSGTSRTLLVVATVTSGGIKTNVAQVSSANEADRDSTPDNAPLVREDDDFTVSLTPSSKIGNYVWRDLNGDGIQNEPESAGVNGVVVRLFRSTGEQVAGPIQTANDADGKPGFYSFNDIDPGRYYVVFTAAPGDNFTTRFATSAALDSNVDSSGRSDDFDLLSGVDELSIDAGFSQEVRIGNFVWDDLDMDGIQDSNETGIGGVTINLTGTSSGGTAISRSTTTASDGSYQFSALPPGTYQVAVAASNFIGSGALSTYAASPTLVGTNRAIDSNVSPSSTSPATLTSGSSDHSVDFGYYRTTRVCVNLFLEGNTATSGPAGNIITVSSGGISAKVSGFSRNPLVTHPLTAWAPAYVGRFGGGLGVTDTSEGSGAGNAHTIDNIGRENYLLFVFSQAVTIDTAFLGYVAGDSDVRVWIGNSHNAFNTTTTLSNAFLSSLGAAEVNLGAGLTRTADINAANATGNILVISANTGELKPNDQFKVAELGLCAIVPMASAGTKFFTIDDDANRTFKYGSVGNAMDNFAVVPTNPRGITSNVSGSNVWIADHAGRIFNYTSAGAHVANWDSRISGLQGVTTNGTHIWTVSGSARRVYYYPNGTTRANGSSVSPTSSFALNFYNSNPTDLTTDGRFIWVVNEGGTTAPDMVFKYTLSGSFLGRWQLDSANSRPTGITVDPAGGNKLWVVDSGTDRIYEYSGATGCISGGLIASKSYALASGNTNPQGIADPPGPGEMAEAHESSLVVNEQYVDQNINPSFNALNAADVNSDGVVSPLDALLVINRLNASRRSVDYTPATWMFDDVSNDGVISPIDALLVINQLNRRQSSSQPTETPASQPDDANPPDSDVSGSDESDAPNDDLGSAEGENGPTDAFFASYDPQLAAFSGGSASDPVSSREDEERGLRRRPTIRLR